MASFSEIANRKVAGVPVLYLAGAFVAILAIVAWKMKPSVPADEPTGDEATTGENVPDDPNNPDYSGLNTQGTVTVVQGTQTAEPAAKATNEDWERSAVDYLVEAKLATPSEAQSAINKYLAGDALSFDEGKLKDAAIIKLKLPPEPLATLGTVATTAPAQKQFTQFPGKHTVKGSNDNTTYKLAILYYGNGAVDKRVLISAANPKLGGVYTTYVPGTVVSIPVSRAPQYYKVTASTRWTSQIAKKNGTTPTAITALNPSLSAPYTVGKNVRVA